MHHSNGPVFLPVRPCCLESLTPFVLPFQWLRLIQSLSSHVAASLNAVVVASHGTGTADARRGCRAGGASVCRGVAASLVALLTALLRCRRPPTADGEEWTPLLKPAVLSSLQADACSILLARSTLPFAL